MPRPPKNARSPPIAATRHSSLALRQSHTLSPVVREWNGTLQAFEDGIYFVFLNEDQKTTLTDTFRITPETKVTFWRLVALAGG